MIALKPPELRLLRNILNATTEFFLNNFLVMEQKEFSFFGLADINSNWLGRRDERDAFVMRLQRGSSKIL